MARKPSDKKIIEAFQRTGGNLSASAKLLGVSRQSVNNWVKANPALKTEREQAIEGLLDMAENKLFKAIEKGNMTAIIWALKTLGKARGYVERQELAFDKDDVIEVTYKNED